MLALWDHRKAAAADDPPLSVKQIARVLNIKPRTVAFHKYGMMRQLGVCVEDGISLFPSEFFLFSFFRLLISIRRRSKIQSWVHGLPEVDCLGQLAPTAFLHRLDEPVAELETYFLLKNR